MNCIARGLMGCRDCVAIRFTVLQERAGKVGSVSQYTSVYRNTPQCIVTVEQRQGWTVLQYSAQPSHDTARRLAGSTRWGALGVRGARRHGAGARRQALGRGRWGASWRAGACWQADARQASGTGKRARGRAGVQGRASCAATRHPYAVTRPGGSATIRPDPSTTRLHARGLGAAWALVGLAGWVSWAKLVHCAPGSVLTQF